MSFNTITLLMFLTITLTLPTVNSLNCYTTCYPGNNTLLVHLSKINKINNRNSVEINELEYLNQNRIITLNMNYSECWNYCDMYKNIYYILNNDVISGLNNNKYYKINNIYNAASLTSTSTVIIKSTIHSNNTTSYKFNITSNNTTTKQTTTQQHSTTIKQYTTKRYTTTTITPTTETHSTTTIKVVTPPPPTLSTTIKSTIQQLTNKINLTETFNSTDKSFISISGTPLYLIISIISSLFVISIIIIILISVKKRRKKQIYPTSIYDTEYNYHTGLSSFNGNTLLSNDLTGSSVINPVYSSFAGSDFYYDDDIYN